MRRGTYFPCFAKESKQRKATRGEVGSAVPSLVASLGLAPHSAFALTGFKNHRPTIAINTCLGIALHHILIIDHIDIPHRLLERIARGAAPFGRRLARHGVAWRLVAVAETVALGHFKTRLFERRLANCWTDGVSWRSGTRGLQGTEQDPSLARLAGETADSPPASAGQQAVSQHMNMARQGMA